MKSRLWIGSATLAASMLVLVLFAWGPTLAGSQAGSDNPCGAKAVNPCEAKGGNPCNPCGANPCARIPGAANPCGANPCGANPCGANPCGASRIDPAKVRQPEGVRLASGTRPDLLAKGEDLWNDRSLGRSGLACSSCHLRTDDGLAQVQASFAEPYPHRVEMAADVAGLAQVNAAEMVQLCMTVPMASDPLPWDSIELAALSAQVEHLQQELGAKAAKSANPCAANPCAMKSNPCAANPCATKSNPCAGR